MLNVTLVLEQDFEAGIARINLTGPGDVWFGVGFNAQGMSDRPYAIIVDGSSGSFQERKLDKYKSGDPLAFTLTELDSSRINGKCHMAFERPLLGDFQFPVEGESSTLNMIAAIGSEPFFSVHEARTTGQMTLERT